MAEKSHDNQKVISIKGFIEKKAAQRLDFAITKSQTLLEILLIEITHKRLADQQMIQQISRLKEMSQQITKISHKQRITKKDRAALAAILSHSDVQAIAYINDEVEKCLTNELCPAALLKTKLKELCVNISDFAQIYKKNKETIEEQLEKIQGYLPIHLAQTRSLLLKAKNDPTFLRERYEKQKENFTLLLKEFDRNLRNTSLR